ncbi:MAG: hypothetical protein JOZ70_08485 [Pseudolabrys sp.]|nr:hypothetical protein [Pseudolabrys sp.]MBV9955274.1 hypothetical protein [Pseudolabrys sp.]
MRYAAIAALAGLLLMPATAPAKTFGAASLNKPTFDLAAAKKKKEKVEYMRSAAGPEPKAKPAKKAKKKAKAKKG